MTHMPEDFTAEARVPGEIERRRDALAAKAEFEAFIRGGQARSTLLPRAMLRDLAWAAADLMVLKIVNGHLKPKSAKEAADIARMMQEVARREAGESDTTVTITTPEQRANAIARFTEMREQAMRRQAIEAGQGPADDSIEDADVVDDDLVAGTEAGYSVPQSTPSGVKLRRVRAS